MTQKKKIGEVGFVRTLRETRDRLAARPDSEHEQALIRIFMFCGIFAYLLSVGEITDSRQGLFAFGLAYTFLFFVISVILFIAILRNPAVSVARRVIGIFADVGGFTIGTAFTHELVVPWYGVYLWITLGNGFRYGEKYLYLSCGLSVVGFFFVLKTNTFWKDNEALGAGLLVTLIVIPGYASSLIRKLRKERKRAEQANRAKSDFLARMSHEIRTPLNGIIGISELLKTARLGREEREHIEAIYASGRTLFLLIEDILDISKIEAGKLVLEETPFDLHTLVRTTGGMLKPQADAKGISFSTHIGLDTPYRLLGDSHHVRQILINLIGNAIKFTEKGSVETSCYTLRRHHGKALVRFEVVDSGIGIDPEKQEGIFDTFTQADETTTRRFGGSGLGTTIAKQLVELMGGRIGLKSTPRIGSTFWFDIEFSIVDGSTDLNGEVLEQCRVLRICPKELVHSDTSGYMDGWNVNYRNVHDLREAIRTLMNQRGGASDFQVLILDGVEIDENTIAFMKSVRVELSLSEVSILVVLRANQTLPDVGDWEEGILALRTPVNQALLFNALHASRSVGFESEDIIRFADHLPQEGKRSVSRNILVAEDNSTNRMVIGRILERAGHRFDLVENGEQALEALERSEYDLAIVDMHMPVLGGLEAYKLYRFAHAGEESIPFILLTANATIEARRACKDVGIDHFLTKPISSVRLEEAIATATSHLPAHLTNGPDEADAKLDGLFPIIDRDLFDQVVALGGSDDFLARLRHGFQEDTSELLRAMADALDAKEKAHFLDLAHAVKGAAINLGLRELGAIAARANRLSKNELERDGRVCLKELKEAFGRAMSALDAELLRRTSASK